MIEPKTMMMLAGTAVQALGAISSGMQAKNNADFEAEQLRQSAERDRQIAAQQAEDFKDEQSRKRARLRVLTGGATEGTPLQIASEIAGETEFQAMRIRATGDEAARQSIARASLRESEGKAARSAGFMKAGSTLLTGASKAKFS